MIRLEENNIKEIHCPKVGFLTQCHPRASLIKVFEERIKQAFIGSRYPQFYCTVEYISVRQTTTKVVVIRSAEKDVKEMLDLFKKAHKLNLHTFVPWREWNAMISSKQLDLIQKQNKNITNSKSIILSGFKDNANIKFNYCLLPSDDMIFAEENEQPNIDYNKEYCNSTVDEFLYKHYKDCNGKELFQHIYPVALGVREILVQHKHAKEVIELCKEIKEDMFLHMSFDAADEIFDDVDAIRVKSINHSIWEPFSTPNNYNEAYAQQTYNDKMENRKYYKRSNDTELAQRPKISYAQATSNQVTQSNTQLCPHDNHTSKMVTPKESLNHPNAEMQLFRQQLLELKATQADFETKQEQSNSRMFEELKRTNDHIKITQEDFEAKQEKCTNDYINNNVMPTIAKTNNDISEIKQQIFSLEVLNNNVNAVLQYVKLQAQHNATIQNSSSNNTNDMMIDKDGYKRSFNGKLRDDNGNISWAENHKENIPTGGNQNNCNINETEFFGASNP
jgi:hypothetical protein